MCVRARVCVYVSINQDNEYDDEHRWPFPLPVIHSGEGFWWYSIYRIVVCFLFKRHVSLAMCLHIHTQTHIQVQKRFEKPLSWHWEHPTRWCFIRFAGWHCTNEWKPHYSMTRSRTRQVKLILNKGREKVIIHEYSVGWLLTMRHRLIGLGDFLLHFIAHSLMCSLWKLL